MKDRPDDVPAQAAHQPQATPPAGSGNHADPTLTAMQAAPAGQPGAQQPAAPPRPAADPYATGQQPGGYGPPPPSIPAQQHPYAQPGYIQPAPPQAGGKGTAGHAVAWAAVGALIASALWAGGVFLLDLGDGDKADLAGYRAKSNLCSAVDYSSVRTEYTEEDSAPTHNSLEHDALDQSYCSISLKKSSASSYSDAYLSVQMDLHKETDPAAEFTALWSEYDQRYDDYEVDEVNGFGDEAYLVTQDTTSGSGTSGSKSVILAVRDGWMTYQMSWSAYASSYGSTPADVTDVSGWLKTDTKSTLENLRSD
ncbi:hypothetical protein ACWERY_34095 [Streptomyces sp. NPDC004082]|uniref:hypothetical protein n=1 Tax=unclassified Streptomyces TaxID=2593676 RepID=UPI0033AA0F6C